MDHATENNVEKKYNLRPLEGTDIFVMTGIISKIGVRNIAKCWETDELKAIKAEIKEKGKDAVDVDEVGSIIIYNVLDLVLEKLEYCENGICKLLSNLSGKTPAEIKALGAVEYLEMFMDVIRDERFIDFFTRAYELLKKAM